eukprot:g4437.t1
MKNVDQKNVNQVVYEMSKNSKHFQAQLKKDENTNRKIERLKKKLAECGEPKLSREEYRRIIEVAESGRCLNRTWCVVDMDQFFAAVAMREDPNLVGKPVAVGGIGMISTANYVARKFGVRSAMPGFIAKKLCPNLIFVKSDFELYQKVAAETREIFKEYDPNFTPASLDEAYLDITDYLARLRCDPNCGSQNTSKSEDDDDDDDGDDVENVISNRSVIDDAVRIVQEIRDKIYAKTKLTCSAGIAPNKMLAKILSDVNKPNGQACLPHNRVAIITFMQTLPCRKIPGIGRVTQRILKEVIGCDTCGDLFNRRHLLPLLNSKKNISSRERFSNSTTAGWLLRVCLGISDSKKAKPTSQGLQVMRKGIGKERTFRSNIKTVDELLVKMRDISKMLTEKMKNERSLKAKTWTLKLKSAGYELKTRAATLASHTNDLEIVYEALKPIVMSEFPSIKKEGVRLLGVRASNFEGVRAMGQSSIKSMFTNSIDERSETKMNERKKEEVYTSPYKCSTSLPKEEGKIEEVGTRTTLTATKKECTSGASSPFDYRLNAASMIEIDQEAFAALPPDVQQEIITGGVYGGKKKREKNVSSNSIEKFFNKKRRIEKPTSWKCTVCTFENRKMYGLVCEMCKSERKDK